MTNFDKWKNDLSYEDFTHFVKVDKCICGFCPATLSGYCEGYTYQRECETAFCRWANTEVEE